MSTPPDDPWAPLLHELDAARAAQDHPALADLLVRLGAAYLSEKRLSDAANAFALAVDHARSAKDPRRESAARRGHGALLARMPGRAEEAEETLRRSALLAKQAGDVLSEALTRRELLRLLLDTEQWAKAGGEASAALDRLEGHPDSMAKIDFLRGRATANKARARFGAAVDDLAEARRMAAEGGNERLALELRLEVRGLDFLREGGQPEPILPILDAARAIGADGVVVSGELQRATEALAHDPALSESIAAELKRHALEVRDPTTYLLASLLIADARGRRDDDVGVLEALVTCHHSLRDAFGPEMGAQLQPILDDLPKRWGADRFQRAFAALKRPQAR